MDVTVFACNIPIASLSSKLVEIFIHTFSRNGCVIDSNETVAFVTAVTGIWSTVFSLSLFPRVFVQGWVLTSFKHVLNYTDYSIIIHLIAVKVRAHELRPKGKEELLNQVRLPLVCVRSDSVSSRVFQMVIKYFLVHGI